MPTCEISYPALQDWLNDRSLRLRFAGSQAGGDRAARLGNVVLLAFDLFRPDSAIVLVTPYDELDGIVEHRLGHVLLRPVLDPVHVSGCLTSYNLSGSNGDIAPHRF